MEPELPKLPNSKIKPNIQPNKIIGGGKVTYGGAKSRGVNPLVRNITGSDNLFSKLRERNPEVSNKRGTRTLFNMLGTFGTERNEKIIRKNLQLLRNTLVETFEIAKLLRMNAADGAGGSGGGKNYSGALLVGTLAATAGLTLPKLLGGNDDKTNIKETEETEEKVDKEDDLETFVSSEEKLVAKELEDTDTDTEYDDDKLESDLEGSSKGLVESIKTGFSELMDGIKKLVKGEGIDTEETEVKSGDDTLKVEESGDTNESDQVNSLVDGVSNSFKGALKTKIAEGESNNDYGAMYSRDQEGFDRGDEDITKMSINEVDKLQTDYLNYQTSIGREDGDRSAAMGAYQMLNPKKVAEQMGLDPETTIFDKETQDKMSEYFLNYSGLKEFQAGEISAEEFNNRLAEQFASVKTTDGKGVYDDDGMNKANTSVLDLIKAQESKYKDLDKGAFIPGEKPGEVIVVNQGGGVTPVSGGGKKVVMSNSNTGKGKSQGPTQKFYSSSNPDASNLSTKSILGVIG